MRNVWSAEAGLNLHLRDSRLAVKQLLFEYCVLDVLHGALEYCKYHTELITAVAHAALRYCDFFADAAPGGEEPILHQRAVCRSRPAAEQRRLMGLACALSAYPDWHHSQRRMAIPRAHVIVAASHILCSHHQREGPSCTLSAADTKLVFKVVVMLLTHMEQYEALGMSSSHPAGRSAAWHAEKYEAAKPARHSEDPIDIASRHREQYFQLLKVVAKLSQSNPTQPVTRRKSSPSPPARCPSAWAC